MSLVDGGQVGSRWWCFDFHTHTPASDDYGKGPQRDSYREVTPTDWLLDFMRAEIDCVAVTDHNSGAWVDLLKAALQALEEEAHTEFRPLTVFPGVEISVSGGVHILAILSPGCSTSDIDSLLGAVGFSGTKGSCDSVTNMSICKVVDTVRGLGGIAIPAHVDARTGLFKEVHGMTLEQVLQCRSIFAMEVVDATYEPPGLYRDAKLSWAKVLGSDSHHPASSAAPGLRYPGSHFTWVKMGKPTLEGLRLALLDGDEGWSTRRSDVTSDNPNEHANLVIESLEVSDARYLGRGAPFEIQFSPWLTTIIGGRGTGKSTLVEFLRIVMRREGELPEQLNADFGKYRGVYQHREDDGLMTLQTRLRAVYRKDGVRFRIQWSQTGDVEPIEEETSSGNWETAAGEVNRRFPVRIYSQKQIYYLAGRPSALLEVIDDAPKIRRAEWNGKWSALKKNYLALRAKARQLAVSPDDESALRGELDDVKRRLSIFEEVGQADVLKAYQRRQQQRRALEKWEESWADAGPQIRALAQDLVPEPLDTTRLDLETEEDREIERLSEDFRLQIEGVVKSLQAAATEVEALTTKWNTARRLSRWDKAVTAAQEAYRVLQERLQAEGVPNTSAYGQLVQDRQRIEQRLVEMGNRREESARLQQQATEVFAELEKWRGELTQRRQAFLSGVLDDNPYIRIDIVPFGAVDSVPSEVRRLLQRDGNRAFEKDIGAPGADGLLGDLYPDDQAADGVGDRLATFKAALVAIAEGRQSARDARFASHLAGLTAEAFDHLALWFPGDSVDVKYSSTSDGKGFRSIQEGSPGQKTAALLAFLLSYGEEPLILDQPEDDLDNRLIYELIVAQLRSLKSRRQVVVVTHNPNIVVNGDAELVVALAARGGQTQIDCSDSLQSRVVRDVICAIMEGGRQAFDRRYHRIALEMDHAGNT